MRIRSAGIALLLASLSACTEAPRPTDTTTGRPLDVLPAGADLALVRQDLLATASARFGAEAVKEALGAPTYLIAKRFAGIPPPPPPDAGPDWTAPTPTALLIRRADGWVVATDNGWRRANDQVAADLDQVVVDPRFWSERAHIPPCPDYGASLLLLKVTGKAETTRNSTCTSVAEKAVLAALRA